MDNANLIKMWLGMFVMYLPTVLVCVVAGGVLLVRWRQGGGGSVWGLLGFGLVLIYCFVLPLGHVLVQRWVFASSSHQSRIWAFTTLSIVGSVWHAVIYALLLVAIFAGRPKPGAAVPPAYNQP